MASADGGGFSSFMANVPWQAKLAFVYGPMTLMTGWLVYMLTTGVVAALLTGNAALQKQNEALILITRDHADMKAVMGDVLKVLRVDCVRNSKTDEAKQACNQ